MGESYRSYGKTLEVELDTKENVESWSDCGIALVNSRRHSESDHRGLISVFNRWREKTAGIDSS